MPGKGRRRQRGHQPTAKGKAKAKSKPAPIKVLPPKESTLFKSILRSYERKEYKKGLKTADTILRKYPEHGETLAMKGLILNSQDKKPEAYELVRKGLKNDLRSYVCWHVFGLLHRSDRNYKQAIVCYQNALKQQGDNLQILRDLSHLQVQMRDYAGYLATRKKLLRLKPSNTANWISLIVASHLAKNYKLANHVVKEYVSTLETADHPDFEVSETLMYQVMIAEEQSAEMGLETLEKVCSQVLDVYGVLETRARLLEKLDRLDEAKEVYEHLVSINPEQYDYHLGVLRCMKLVDATVKKMTPALQLDEAKQTAIAAVFEAVLKDFPRCKAAVHIPLFVLQGDAFKAQLEKYLQPGLRKGVPSLFSALKPLYTIPERTKTIESTMASYVESLKSKETFPGSEDKEQPTTLLWTLAFSSWHYSHVGQASKALELIEEAIAHTPTAIDLYLHKAKIYKRAGALQKAAQTLDYARTMDLADRYLNTLSTKYWLRAGNNDTADSVISLFTKDDGTDSQNHLYDMQCLWYEGEAGCSYLRKKEYGLALKKFIAMEKHFQDFVEDQFDFHSYCIRKNTLGSYVKLLRLEDNILGHKHMVLAASKIIQTYLELDKQPKAGEVDMTDPALANLSESELRKWKRKQRKEQLKKEQLKKQTVQEKEKEHAQKKKSGRPGNPHIDEDPCGEKLIDAEHVNFLDECTKYLKTLNMYSKNSLETYLLGFDVAARRNKVLLQLKALKSAIELAPNHPQTHLRKVEFVHKMAGYKHDNEVVNSVVQRELKAMVGDKTVLELNSGFVEANKDSYSHILAGARVTCEHGSTEQKAAALQSLQDQLTQGSGSSSISHTLAEEALQFIQSQTASSSQTPTPTPPTTTTTTTTPESESEASAAFRALCHEKFPLTPSFFPTAPTTVSDEQ